MTPTQEQACVMIDPAGYVKIWRKLKDNPLWQSPNQNAKVLFVHLMLSVNWQPRPFLSKTGLVEVCPGELVTSYANLAIENHMTIKEVRGALNVLEVLGITARSRAQQWTKVTLLNWSTYQSNETSEGTVEGNVRATSGQGEGNVRATTKECKKERRVEGKNKQPSNDGFENEEFKAYIAVFERRPDRQIEQTGKAGSRWRSAWKVWEGLNSEERGLAYAHIQKIELTWDHIPYPTKHLETRDWAKAPEPSLFQPNGNGHGVLAINGKPPPVLFSDLKAQRQSEELDAAIERVIRAHGEI